MDIFNNMMITFFCISILGVLIGFCIRLIYEHKYIKPFYHTLFNHSRDGIVVYRPVSNGKDFIFISVNPQVEKIESVKKDDLLYRRVTSVFPGIKKFGLFAVFQQVLQTGEPQEHPIALYSDNRITGWRSNYVFRLPNHHIVAIYSDTTKEKENEERLLQIIDDIQYTLADILIQANVMHDDDTGDHLKRMGAFATYLAYQYYLHHNTISEDFIKKVRLYAPLHDVGKVGLSDKILKTSEIYTPAQRLQMQEHVVIGAELLTNELIDKTATSIALYHHEKWDGTGYKQQLKGTDIPLSARMVTIADVYDALISETPYKKAFSEKNALAEIKAGSGTFFDPTLVDLFISNPEILQKIAKDPLHYNRKINGYSR